MKKDERFMLDIYVKSDFDLSKFGLDAKAICLPRRSEGSIGIKTSTSELLYGDLLEDTKKPAKNSLIADKKAFGASFEKLNGLKIIMVIQNMVSRSRWKSSLKIKTQFKEKP